MVHSITHHGRRLAHDRTGAIAPIFGVVASVVMVSAGFAIDYGRAVAARADLQGALDVAALAAAKALSTGTTDTTTLTKLARDMFDANVRTALTAPVAGSDFTLAADAKTKTVTLAVSARMPTAFMGLVAIDQLDIGAQSSSVVDGTKFEIAMMLDATGSMGDKPKGGSVAKLTSLKSAAADFVNTMLPAGGGTKDIVRIGLVPFAASVNAGGYAATVTGGKSAACVTERYDAAGQIDASDASGAVSPVGTAASAACPSLAVRPMTNDAATLLADIAALKASGSTAGHLGTIWARYLLSSKWSDVWTGAAASATGTKGVKKVAILMTDGLYNTSYSQKGKMTQVEPNAVSTGAALAACQAMDKETTVVYTIGFDLSGASGGWAKTLLQDCASTITDPNGKTRKAFYDVADDAALKAAYQDIAAQLLRIRVSS